MMTETAHIHLSIPASSEFVVVARLSVSGIAARMNFTVEDIEDIKIALSEACTNAIQHAYDQHEGGGKKIDIHFILAGDKLEIEVRDTGVGFNPQGVISKKQTDASASDQFGLGLGLTFIKSLMDAYDIQSELGKGTVVKMVKYVSQIIPA